MLIVLVSNVTLLVWLSNFAQCWLPCARLNPVARIPWAPSTAQILKVTLIEWLLKPTLLALHQVFTSCPYCQCVCVFSTVIWSRYVHSNMDLFAYFCDISYQIIYSAMIAEWKAAFTHHFGLYYFLDSQYILFHHFFVQQMSWVCALYKYNAQWA